MSEEGSEGNKDLALLERFAQAVEGGEEGNVHLHVMPDRIIEVIRQRILDVEQQLALVSRDKTCDEDSYRNYQSKVKRWESELKANEERLAKAGQDLIEYKDRLVRYQSSPPFGNWNRATSKGLENSISSISGRITMLEREIDKLQKKLVPDIEFIDNNKSSIAELTARIEQLTALRDRYEDMIMRILEMSLKGS